MPRPLLHLKRRMLGVVTQAEIAQTHGVRPEHVCMVLNGHRKSDRLVALIERTLKEREEQAMETQEAS